MLFNENNIYPKFAFNNQASFPFDNAKLIISLPVIENEPQNLDYVSQPEFFKKVDTNDWERSFEELPMLTLAKHIFICKDSTTLSHVAECLLNTTVFEATQQDCDVNNLLSQSFFSDFALRLLDYSYTTSQEHLGTTNDIKNLKNQYNQDVFEHPVLNWTTMTIQDHPDETPTLIATIPINYRFFLVVHIHITKLTYSRHKNPYNNNQLELFTISLFKDFLSHIKIEYGTELIEKIQSLKSKTPA